MWGEKNIFKGIPGQEGGKRDHNSDLPLHVGKDIIV